MNSASKPMRAAAANRSIEYNVRAVVSCRLIVVVFW